MHVYPLIRRLTRYDRQVRVKGNRVSRDRELIVAPKYNHDYRREPKETGETEQEAKVREKKDLFQLNCEI